jgi:hypothetical protein
MMNNDMQLHTELKKAVHALVRYGFAKTPTGEWMSPLGKRPDFEGSDLIAAAVAAVAAQQLNIDCRRQLIDAVQKHKEINQ